MTTRNVRPRSPTRGLAGAALVSVGPTVGCVVRGAPWPVLVAVGVFSVVLAYALLFFDRHCRHRAEMAIINSDGSAAQMSGKAAALRALRDGGGQSAT